MVGVCSTLDWLRPHDFHFAEYFFLLFQGLFLLEMLAKFTISQGNVAFECMLNTNFTGLTASVGEISGIYKIFRLSSCFSFSNFYFTCITCFLWFNALSVSYFSFSTFAITLELISANQSWENLQISVKFTQRTDFFLIPRIRQQKLMIAAKHCAEALSMFYAGYSNTIKLRSSNIWFSLIWK